jgi:hypothetical protein
VLEAVKAVTFSSQLSVLEAVEPVTVSSQLRAAPHYSVILVWELNIPDPSRHRNCAGGGGAVI